MPVPTGHTAETLQSDIADWLSRGSVETRGAASAIQRLPQVLGEAAQVAAESWAADLGADVTATAAASEAAVGLSLLPLVGMLLGALALWVLMLWLLEQFEQLVSLVPWVGPKLRQLVRIMAYPFTQGAEYTSQPLFDALARMLTGFVTAVHWAMVQGLGLDKTPLQVEILAQLEPVHREVDTLWGWVQSIASEVTGISAPPTPAPAPATSGLAALRAQIAEIEQRNDHQGLEISSINQRLSAIEGTLSVLSQEVEHLRVTIYGARASVVGVQDLVHQLDQLQTTVQVTIARQGAELGSHAEALAQLAPLLSLLYLGERGLVNLRTLEQDMCQCPRLPTVGSLIPDALALDLVIAHGV